MNFIKIYEELYRIFKPKIKDINPERLAQNGEYIFPTLPRGSDKYYPRYTIKILNIEPKSISSGKFLAKTDKSKISGYVHDVTIWIGVFIKTDQYFDIVLPDGNVRRAKNTLLLTYLLDDLIKVVDESELELKELSYFYNPFDRSIEQEFEYDTSRTFAYLTFKLSILNDTEMVYSDNELIQKIIQQCNIN